MDFLYFQVRAVIEGNYKHSRLLGRGEEYAEVVIQSAYEDALKTGRVVISQYESKCGEPLQWRLEDGVLIEEEHKPHNFFNQQG